jgi:hypothetical protein
MSVVMDEEIKRWTARRKSALVPALDRTRLSESSYTGLRHSPTA